MLECFCKIWLFDVCEALDVLEKLQKDRDKYEQCMEIWAWLAMMASDASVEMM